MTGRLAAWTKSLVDGVAAAGGAATFSQLPEFVQQYLQRLGGHRDEALRFVQTLKAQGADATNAVLAAAETRAASLIEASDAISRADEFSRPVIFLRYLDPDIARATLEIFRPAVPLTPSGLIYGGIGLILGVALINTVLAPLLIWRRTSG
jgi:Protein of unknown function (DUF2937)